jgi:cytochrome P450
MSEPMNDVSVQEPTGSTLYWDPLDPSLREDPYALWRRLRDEAPLYYNDRYDFYALSRYDDVEAAHLDPRTYSSAHGTTLEMLLPDPYPSGQIIFMDPPEHTRLRALVSRAFTPRRMAAMEDQIRAIAVELLDQQGGRRSFDYVADFGAILPPTVISALLGVPAADQGEMRKAIDTIFHVEEGVGMINDVSANALQQVTEYLHGLILERRAHHQDDLLGALAEAEITEDDGTSRHLDPQEAAQFGVVMFVAGTETVARLIGWAASVLAEHPKQRAELQADRSLIPSAIEELLRYEAPSPVQARWVTSEVELYGQVIPPNSKMVLLTGSAGRDERKYSQPDRFDIHRGNDHHVAFGYGIHYCLGAALARAEGRIAIEETLNRWPEWGIDSDGARLLYTSTVRGFENLPILLP